MDLEVWKEGKFILISNKKYGITTQGKSLREALINFQDAFLICIHDADWRHVHSFSDAEYAEFLKKEEAIPRIQETSSVNLGDLVIRLVQNVKKTSYCLGVATS